MHPSFWRGKRVLVTGHTGFKGGWLCLLLDRLGATVCGYARDPSGAPSLFEQASVADVLDRDIRADIRDVAAVRRAVAEVAPDVLLHLAAQTLVRPSYEDPLETFSSNVQGTANVLDAVRHAPSVRAVVVVTSDKAYRNEEWSWGYRESDPLGGKDPYSASKAAAEIVTASYRASFLHGDGARVGTARAGNVIGGGDWSPMRLLPDLMRGFAAGEDVVIRSPRAVRPWQHALEPLSGYLLLAERLHEGVEGSDDAWNFGPGEEDARPVEWLCSNAAELWGRGARWRIEALEDGRETTLLRLDTAKARHGLGWRPRWSLHEGLERTVSWYRRVGVDASPSRLARDTTLDDVERFLAADPATTIHEKAA